MENNLSNFNVLPYSNKQLLILVVLRVVIGWHIFYEGLSKLLNPSWSSLGYLMDSKGIFAEFFYTLASNPSLLKVVDLLNAWGLLIIGLCFRISLAYTSFSPTRFMFGSSTMWSCGTFIRMGMIQIMAA